MNSCIKVIRMPSYVPPRRENCLMLTLWLTVALWSALEEHDPFLLVEDSEERTEIASTSAMTGGDPDHTLDMRHLQEERAAKPQFSWERSR
jgi:hypothetical protein